MSKMALIARLREGILNADDYAEVAKSRASLKVRICNLRDEGFVIRSIPVDSLEPSRAPKVAYQLISMPDMPCRCCGRPL